MFVMIFFFILLGVLIVNYIEIDFVIIFIGLVMFFVVIIFMNGIVFLIVFILLWLMNIWLCNNYFELCECKYSNIIEVGCYNLFFVCVGLVVVN